MFQIGGGYLLEWFSFVHVLGLFLSILMGVVMGLVGGGGAIMTVPLLVYLFKLDPSLATLGALLVVGSTAIIGVVTAHRQGNLIWRESLKFGIPSVVGVSLTRIFLVHQLPDVFISFGGFVVRKDMVLMVAFAILMLTSAIKMIRRRPFSELTPNVKASQGFHLPVEIHGFLVGGIIGLLGAGGFLIIPVLVFVIKLPMKRAVGSALLIISVNCLVGFLSDLIPRYLAGSSAAILSLPWGLFVGVTAMGMLGLLIGSGVRHLISDQNLKKAFGWFILIMGTSILFEQLRHLHL